MCIRRIWPMLAHACCAGMVDGRFLRPSAIMPWAIAPDDTRRTRFPERVSSAIASTSERTRFTCGTFSSEVRILLPTLTTMVALCAISFRKTGKAMGEFWPSCVVSHGMQQFCALCAESPGGITLRFGFLPSAAYRGGYFDFSILTIVCSSSPIFLRSAVFSMPRVSRSAEQRCIVSSSESRSPTAVPVLLWSFLIREVVSSY